MHNIYPILFLFLATSGQVFAQSSEGCDGLRFVSPIFPEVEVTTVQYGSNTGFSGTEQDLLMDVYEPVGDDLSQRPVIVLAHAGAFVEGERGDLQDLCLTFAQRGYVAATIDYRLLPDPFAQGFPPDTLLALDLIIKDYSDMKAAVRYFRQDAATTNQFRIDPERVFVGGASAGAIISLHVAYLDETDSIPDYLSEIIADNGGFEGNSGDSLNLQYSSEVSGVVNLSGSIYREEWMKEGDAPLASYHGTADQVVPFGNGFLSSGAGPIVINLVRTDGSGVLHARAETLGIPNVLKAVEGGGHTNIYTPAFEEELENFSAEALLLFHNELLCPGTVVSTEEVADLPIKIYPNPASTECSIELPNWLTSYHIKLYDQLGRLVLDKQNQTAAQFRLQPKTVGRGLFLLQIQSAEDPGQIVTRRVVFE